MKLFRNLQQILPIAVLHHGLGQFDKLLSSNPPFLEGNLLETRHLQALTLLNDLDKGRGLGQRVVRARVEPGKASLQRLYLQLLLFQILLVDGGDFEFAPCTWLMLLAIPTTLLG